MMLVLMMLTLVGRLLTDEAAEIMMVFLNEALILDGSSYRFPEKVSTFKSRTHLY